MIERPDTLIEIHLRMLVFSNKGIYHVVKEKVLLFTRRLLFSEDRDLFLFRFTEHVISLLVKQYSSIHLYTLFSVKKLQLPCFEISHLSFNK